MLEFVKNYPYSAAGIIVFLIGLVSFFINRFLKLFDRDIAKNTTAIGNLDKKLDTKVTSLTNEVKGSFEKLSDKLDGVTSHLHKIDVKQVEVGATSARVDIALDEIRRHSGTMVIMRQELTATQVSVGKLCKRIDKLDPDEEVLYDDSHLGISN